MSKPPDIVIWDNAGNPIAAMACKKIRTSDEDRKYFKYHQGEARDVVHKTTSPEPDDNPFLKKLGDT